MLTEKLSLGLSLRRIFVTGGNVSYRTNVTSAGRTTGGPTSIVIQSTEHGGAAANAYNLIVFSPTTYQIPQVSEIRTGTKFNND